MSVRKKIIFYELRHINNPRLHKRGHETITTCPIKWHEENSWEDKEHEASKYHCYITCIVYEDPVINSDVV